MTPSLQQDKILTWVKEGSGSAIIEASAGSGKTSTLGLVTAVLPPTVSCAALAFAKVNALDFAARFPRHIQCGTFHSRAYQALRRSLPRSPRIDGNKIFNLLKDNFTKNEVYLYGKFVNRLVGYGKNAGLGTPLAPNSFDEWYSLIDHHSLQLDSDDADEQIAVQLAMNLLNLSNDTLDVIDFDDMLYLALLRNVIFDKLNWLLLDEAQDTNTVQRSLLHRMVAAPNGRLLAVGDTHQGIYGFRGADCDAMEKIKSEFNCTTLRLSVCWRCSRAVVAEARKGLADPTAIEPAPDAPEGSVQTLTSYGPTDFNQDDAILCRVTAPLVGMAFSFIKRKIGVRILGRDIGENLITIVKKMNATNVDVLRDRLDAWQSRETRKLYARGHDSQAGAIEDKHTALCVFIDQLAEDNRTVTAVVDSIQSLFTNNNKGLLTLATVHKAKGLEWNRVFILDKRLYMPSKWAKQEWEHTQERNLVHVATTRPHLHLRYISSNCWQKSQPIKLPESTQRQLDILSNL